MKTQNALTKALVAAALSMAASLTLAADKESDAVKPPAIFKENRCHSCHAVDKPLIGPPYRAIAAVHAANQDIMRNVLKDKIINGGGSNWGLVPMVPNPQVTDAEADQLIDWIFSLQAN